jgi:transposase
MNGNTGHWVGIDVSKSKLDVAVLDVRGKVKQHVFSNNAAGHAALVGWLRERAGTALADLRVCMEATGPYSEAAASALADAAISVSVVNPARIKAFAQSELARNKTDRADAALLARFGQAMQPEVWVPPSPAVRELRALVDRLQALKDMQQQEANRLEAAMNQAGMRASIESHLVWLRTSIAQLEGQIDDHIDQHPALREDVKLITSIPGVGNPTAAKVLAYLGDVRRFSNGKALAAFIGVTPRLKLSGSSVRGRSMISRSGHAGTRQCLYMPAMVALKHNPRVSAFGLRLREAGLAPKAVIAACMHKLVLLIYGILKSGRPFDPQFGAARLDLQDGI